MGHHGSDSFPSSVQVLWVMAFAHVFAQNGFKVTIVDISLAQLDKAIANIS
jgi:hypothetical protein